MISSFTTKPLKLRKMAAYVFIQLHTVSTRPKQYIVVRAITLLSIFQVVKEC